MVNNMAAARNMCIFAVRISEFFWSANPWKCSVKVAREIYTKTKAVALHAMEALEGERRYSSYPFSTLALDAVEWSASRPDRALAPGKDPRHPLYRRLGGPQSRSVHRD
jgi:hypothetical protein